MGSGETVGYSILGVALGVPIAIGLFFLLKDSLKGKEDNTQSSFVTGGGRKRESKHRKLSKKRKTAKRKQKNIEL